MSLGTLKEIDPSAFAHPHDLKALDSLRSIPYLPTVLRRVAEMGSEERFRCHHMQSSIRLGPRQFPTLWRMVNEVAERLDMAPPDAYVTREGGINAFAFGMNRYSILLTADLVDLMLDRELEAIVAHELAHILCQHMLYRRLGLTLADPTSDVLARVMSLSPRLVQHSLMMLFMAWSRAAEYSADRAALLVMEDPEPITSCLSRLAGVPRRFQHEFDPRQFSEQLVEYESESTFWSKLATLDMGLLRTHPEPTSRAVALLEWADSEEYRKILRGEFPRLHERKQQDFVQIEGVASCPLCYTPVGHLEQCPHCELDQDPDLQSRCSNKHLVATSWSFCRTCGEEL